MKKSTVAMLMARTSVDWGSRVVVCCRSAEIKEDTFAKEYAGWKILQGNSAGSGIPLEGQGMATFDRTGTPGIGQGRGLQPHRRPGHLKKLPWTPIALPNAK
jgi:hypothetical protein